MQTENGLTELHLNALTELHRITGLSLSTGCSNAKIYPALVPDDPGKPHQPNPADQDSDSTWMNTETNQTPLETNH